MRVPPFAPPPYTTLLPHRDIFYFLIHLLVGPMYTLAVAKLFRSLAYATELPPFFLARPAFVFCLLLTRTCTRVKFLPSSLEKRNSAHIFDGKTIHFEQNVPSARSNYRSRTAAARRWQDHIASQSSCLDCFSTSTASVQSVQCMERKPQVGVRLVRVRGVLRFAVQSNCRIVIPSSVNMRHPTPTLIMNIFSTTSSVTHLHPH